MKNIFIKNKRKHLIGLFILLCSISINAAAQTGVVYTAKVVKAMPAFAKTDTLIQLEKQRYQKEYMAMEKPALAYQQYADSLRQIASAAGATELQKKTAEAAIDSVYSLKTNLDEYAQNAQQKMKDYAQLLQRPYFDKITQTVKSVALRRKLLMVQEASGLLYLAASIDITDDVIKEISNN